MGFFLLDQVFEDADVVSFQNLDREDRKWITSNKKAVDVERGHRKQLSLAELPKRSKLASSQPLPNFPVPICWALYLADDDNKVSYSAFEDSAINLQPLVERPFSDAS